MRYEIFVINIIIKPENVWENPITYSGTQIKLGVKKSTLTNFEGEGLAILLFSCMKNYQSLLVYIIYYEVILQ